MRRKLAVLAALIALFASALSFVNATPASACPIFMTPTLCDIPPRDRFKDFIEAIDW